MYETQADATIISRSLAEPDAFAEIFDRHYDAIRDYLARRLQTALGEELAAETFLIAFEKRSSYDLGYPSARPWLFGIATNLLGRHRRDERRRMAAYGRSPVAYSGDETEDASARADASMVRREIGRAIAELDPGDRDALLLQALAELTYPEIG
jgi:RNA polymerase sigma factor (sigma-70 family)